MARGPLLPPVALLAALLAASCGAEPPALPLLHGVVEIQEVRVASRTGGRVAETPVPEGTILEPGTLVARLEAPEAAARRDEARARHAAAAADLERARNGPRPEERAAAAAALAGARARLALLRAGSRKEDLDLARAEIREAEADLAFAEAERSRAEDLHASGTIPRTDLDRARAARDRTRGVRDARAARLALLEAGARPEEIDDAAAAVRAREAEAALLEAGTRAEEIAAAEARAAEARARLDAAEVEVAELEVRAPERALLEVLAVRPGDVVPAGGTVARLHRAGDLWVKVFVPETLLGLVRVGQGASVEVDSFPGRRFAGRVSWIAAQAEFTPRNVQSADERRHQVFAVKVVVADPEGAFHSGMAASVVLESAPPPAR